MRHRSAPLALAFFLAACTSHSRTTRVQVTDSAGVRIVTNASVTGPKWTLSAEPLLDLGTVEGGGPQQFFRVSGAMRLPHGGLLVVNGGSQEVRVFGPDGSLARSFGRAGKGPGEFGFPGPPWRIRGDSLAFWDYGLQRLAIFDSAGSFGRFLSAQKAIMNPSPVAVLPDTRVILGSLLLDMSSGTAFRMMYTKFYLLGPTGEVADTLPEQPFAEYAQIGDRRNGFVDSPIFEARTQTVGDAHGYWVGTARREEVLRYSPTGELTMEVRWPARDRTISPGDREAEIQTRLEGVQEAQRPGLRKLWETVPVAKEFPAYGGLHTDTLGDLWVEDYERPGHTGPATWRVFDAQGALVGVVQLPGEDEFLDAGEDYVVVDHRDEVDVEHVRVYGLSRGDGD